MDTTVQEKSSAQSGRSR